MLAINTEDILELALLPGSFYMPVVTVPLAMAIFGFRSSNRAALVGIIFGFTVALIWKIFLDQTEITSIFPGMLANLIGLMGSHYILGEGGGWQPLDPSSPLALARAARRQAWQWRLQAIRNFRLYPYLQQNLPTQEGFYFFFGFYTMAATYTALYTMGDADVKTYQGLYKGVYYTVLPATTAFLTFPIWPLTMKNRRFMTYFWPLGIGGILFFAGTLLAIMSHFHHMQVMVMMINLLMAVLLLRWPLALFLAFSGTASGCFFLRTTPERHCP